MDVILERCAGLDVHQGTVTACIRYPGPAGERTQVIQTFGTSTPDLLILRDWLAAYRVTHVAMESTVIGIGDRNLLLGAPGRSGRGPRRDPGGSQRDCPTPASRVPPYRAPGSGGVSGAPATVVKGKETQAGGTQIPTAAPGPAADLACGVASG
jgi:hypothetical protein